MAQIDVTPLGDGEYAVTVDDGRGTTRHRVTVSPETVTDLGGGAGAEDVVVASFGFLLEREPKESILGSFDLPIIGRYFPEYREEIRHRLGAT